MNARGGEVIHSKGMETREIHICKEKTNVWETYSWRGHQNMFAGNVEKLQSLTNTSIEKVNEWIAKQSEAKRLRMGSFVVTGSRVMHTTFVAVFLGVFLRPSL